MYSAWRGALGALVFHHQPRTWATNFYDITKCNSQVWSEAELSSLVRSQYQKLASFSQTPCHPAATSSGRVVMVIGYASLAENMARFPESGVLPLSLTTQQEVMGRICFIYGCSHRSDREKCLFFRFPTHVVQCGRWERLCR